MNTSLKGRLRNTNLPLTHGLYPLFEAVINSIHSIDERGNKSDPACEGKITIKFLREPQLKIDDPIKSDIMGFEVIDNGIGFNEENYESFQTLDSEYKSSLGCRGVGRLLWLKAFKKINVISVFMMDDKRLVRQFDFDAVKDIHNETGLGLTSTEIGTTIKLLHLKNDYKKYLRKTASVIARDLLEHCLWYFLREGGAPIINIEDDDEIISLQSKFEELMIDASKSDFFSIKSEKFEVTHVKLKSTVQNKHSLIYSAANRVVKEENLAGKIPGLFGLLNDGESDFTYTCFLTSDFLTNNVNPERLAFNIPESSEGMFLNEDITLHEIRKKSIELINSYLGEYLVQNKESGYKRLTTYIDNKAPRYKPILKRLSDDDKVVDPSISDKDLELKLHSHLMAFEAELLTDGHDLMIPEGIENQEDYTKRIEAYLSKASDLKQSDLANYVAHRKVILDLLGKAIKVGKDGKYSKEEVVHRLLMPMQKFSEEIRFDDSNLWLIDERLAFHNFLSSDKTLNSMSITDSTSGKEPDLLGVNIYDNPLLVNDGESLPLASITVVEIKRPMRDDARAGEDKDPIEQTLGYLKRIRNGKVKTRFGRQIPDSHNIPGFCYVVCDITESIKERCELFSLKVTSDKLGYFGYNDSYNAFIEVISFDRLLNMANERNKAFFDKLGLPSNINMV
jgi:hypothetical protein